MARSAVSPGLALKLLTPAPPAVPAGIATPPGCRLLCELHATGVQVYRSATNDTGLGWVLDAPLATLTDADGAAAYHYDGPTWEGVDGSRVVVDRTVPVKSVPAADPGRDIPWLLVKVRRDGEAPGRLAPAAYVQRLDTAGGKPPAIPPSRVGTKVGVPYTATYRFYAADG